MNISAKRKKAAAPEIDIGRETRLELYRLQVELRYCEKRAYDLFLQNLVKGTSHLSLGQEAIAAAFGVAMRPDDWTFCTYRGHAHTLARGASMAGVLGELMGRECGLLGGKGGSMHLTDVTRGAMGSYAIIGAHLPVAGSIAARSRSQCASLAMAPPTSVHSMRRSISRRYGGCRWFSYARTISIWSTPRSRR
jgi:pyruvate dehydrogenase E1 component alpha subunit